MGFVYLKDGQDYHTLPLHVLAYGRLNNVSDMLIFARGASLWSAVAWPGANRAIYSPIQMPSPFLVARFMVANGGNLTGTVDIGLYNNAGTLLLSTGATVRAVATIQYIDVADQLFPAGHYYIALLATSTSGTYNRTQVNTAPSLSAAGVLQEDVGAATLPATMTPVAYTSADAFHFGFTQSGTL